MANAVTDIIRLGEELRECLEVTERAQGLENACRESETRLSNLREQEAASTRKLGEARAEAKRILDEVTADAQVARERCEDACQRREAEAEKALSELLQNSHTICDELADGEKALRARVADLETEESDLGQKVAVLRDALAGLRAQIA